MSISTLTGSGETVLTLHGPFDATEARRLHDALLGIPPRRTATIDFHEVRVIEDFALAQLADELASFPPGRVTLLGLSEHHHRLLRYFGLDPEPAVARSAAATKRADRMPIVLLVDDDGDLRAVLAEFLSREGYEVHEAGDVREAVRHAAAHQPAVVLLDLAMTNGLQVLEQLREIPDRTAVPVIVISEAQIAQAEGCTVLQKPFTLDALTAALEKMLPNVNPSTRTGPR